jgi:hypothetical protein
VLASPDGGAAGEADLTGELFRRLGFTDCRVKPDPGPCKARFERYYYDEERRACRPFFWGGCEGAVPFETAQACEQACLGPQTLRITGLEPLGGDVYAQVALEFPRAWRQPAFTVLVDGREVPARTSSGGFSADRQHESLIFFPGRPGRRQVAVTTEVAGRRVQATAWLEWRSAPLAALVGHTGDRELILEKQPLALVTLNLDDASVRFNGVEVRAEPFGQDARVLRFEPSWVPGRNTLTVGGAAPDGAPVRRRFSFVYAGDGVLTEGETAILTYGAPGSKSGPFFRVSVDGPALSAPPAAEAMLYVLSEDGWLFQESRLVQELRAATPGTGVVRIFEKPHFRQPEHLRKEIPLTVTARP